MKKSKGHASRQAGFTLIELLVVIAIIGLLATIVLVSLNTARQKARDVRRVGDLRQVALALEMYYDDHSAYPAVIGCTTANWATMGTTYIEADGYMTKVPVDPTGGATYYYAYGGTGSDYTLKATLENNVQTGPLGSDVDGTTIAGAGACTCNDPIYCIQP